MIRETVSLGPRTGSGLKRWVLALVALLPAAVRCELPDELSEALLEARAASGLLVVAFLDDSSPMTPGLRSEIEKPTWLELLAPHGQLVVSAPARSGLLRQLAIRSLPSFLLLDGEGREIGRVDGSSPLESAGRKLREVLEAAAKSAECAARLQENPADAEALYWQGVREWNQGDRVAAVERFEKVAVSNTLLRLGTRDLTADALRMLGEARLEAGHFAEAESAFRGSLNRRGSPEQAALAALGLSRSLRRQGRVREAISAVETHFVSDKATAQPRLDEALFTLGYLYSELGESEKAAQGFRAVMERFPSSRYAQRAGRYGFKTRSLPLGGPDRDVKEESPGSSALENAAALSPAGFAPSVTSVSLTGSELGAQELR